MKMYWTDTNTNKIQRTNLDGSDVENLVTFTQGYKLSKFENYCRCIVYRY